MEPLPASAPAEARAERHREVAARVAAMIEGVDDWIAILSTVACELRHAFAFYDWVGFYRLVGPRTLMVGPYQGGHGCLSIDLDRGVCGYAARTRTTAVVPEVADFPGHIACSSSTRSEIVVPVLAPDGALLAVLDVDSDVPAAFTEVDREALEALCAALGRAHPRGGGGTLPSKPPPIA